MAATEAVSGYALHFKTSGSEGFIATVDIIVEEATVVVLVDHVPLLLELLGDPVCGPEIGHPGCLVPVIGQGLDIGCVWCPDLTVVGAGVLQLVQIVLIACIRSRCEVDVLHEVIVPACLAHVGPGGDPGAHWDLHGLLRRAGQHRHLHGLAGTLLGLSVDLGCSR